MLLIAVEQPVKENVRPVLDFREINQYVTSHTAHADVCDETIRRWRQIRGKMTMLDLKKAYLQICIESDLWKYQTIKHNGQCYFLTRLGFGLSSAPRIMSQILKKVLNLDPCVARGTDHYVDDLIVNEDIVSVDKVVDLLRRYGLETKAPQPLQSTKVLGLQLADKQGQLEWRRGKPYDVPSDFNKVVTRRQLFSICGQLIGHYPIAGWIRVGCGFIKRNSAGSLWEDDIGEYAKYLLEDMLKRVQRNDPVSGIWNPPENGVIRVWCDASSIAMGVIVEIGGVIVEDASWLRKSDDSAHINVAELNAIIRGVNLALKWNANKFELVTDSATVKGWLDSVFLSTHKARAHGIAEMLVRRRLNMLSDLVVEYDLDVSVILVPSSKNKADALTRVPATWLRRRSDSRSEQTLTAVAIEKIQSSHNLHHVGVDRSLSIARQQFGMDVTRSDVEQVVKSCPRCQIIDPAPVRWKHGSLAIEKTWYRLSIDVTHYDNKLYLTIVDCGPGRFAIWRRLSSEAAENICRELQQVFQERGPPAEILMDNGTSFHSSRLKDLCDRWKVVRHFRCAYRPETNGVVERNHRTIKRMAARTGGDPIDMVFWYNAAERVLGDSQSAPTRSVHTYPWRFSDVTLEADLNEHSPNEFVTNTDNFENDSDTDGELLTEEQCASKHSIGNSDFCVGDKVVVKPPGARCTTEWEPSVITGVESDNKVEVDGMSRHVSDIRHAPSGSVGESTAASDQASDESCVVEDYRSKLRPRTTIPNYRV